MRPALRLLMLAMAVGSLAFALVAAPAARADEPPAGRAEILRRRSDLVWEAGRLLQAGKPTEARAALDAMLAQERELFGPDHPNLGGALEHVAKFHERVTDFEAARDALREASAVYIRAGGAAGWQAVNARFALERAERLAKVDAAGRAQLRAARAFADSAQRLSFRY